ncbi:hypothetical protein SBADM41S_01781 [Streptomyces badius]
MLGPLLGAALDNALRSGDAALTGPVARGDAGTVAAHIGELRAHAPQAVAGYVAMARATADRALAHGLLKAELAEDLLVVLADQERRPGGAPRAATRRSSASSALSRPWASARSAVARAIATYPATACGAWARSSPMWAATVRVPRRPGRSARRRRNAGRRRGRGPGVRSRAATPALVSSSIDWATRVAQVVRTQREGQVERARLLCDPLGLAAGLDDQGLGREPQPLGSGDAEGAARA